MRARPLSVATAVFLIWGTACAPSNVYLSATYAGARKMALLPMVNNTNDLDGPIYVRKILFEQLAARGFDLIPLDDVDAKLKAQGFTDGGQLAAATPQQIAQWTGADTLFYPVLEEFNYINIGYYWQRKVKISARIMDGRSGERLWEAERNYSTIGLATNRKEAEASFAVQLAAKAIEKAAHVPLARESNIAVRELMRTLPHP